MWTKVLEFLAYTFAFLALFFISYSFQKVSIQCFIKATKGKSTFRNRRDKKRFKQTFAGRYLFLDFKDCLPKWRYGCFFLAMACCLLLYVMMLMICVSGQKPIYRFFSWTLPTVLICNLAQAYPYLYSSR